MSLQHIVYFIFNLILLVLLVHSMLFYIAWKKKCSYGVSSEREVGSHIDALEHIMISLLNAPFPHGEAPVHLARHGC